MIRDAIEADIPRVLEMSRRFLAEGPYRDDITDNEELTNALALRLVQSPDSRVLVSDEGGELTGLVVMLVYPHYFSGEKTAGELIWYVEPEHRQSWAGIALARAAERVAREMGATTIQFTAPATASADPNVAKMYELLGFHAVETTYSRRLKCQPSQQEQLSPLAQSAQAQV